MRKRLKVKIGPSRLKDMLAFRNRPLMRDKAIEAADDIPVVSDYPINRNAELLHPAFQKMTVAGIMDHPQAGARTLVLNRADGNRAAWFRAGQYVSVFLRIGDSLVSRPYSISSSPRETDSGILRITVKKAGGNFVSGYLLSEIREGDSITVSGPQGQFFHDRLRDSNNVVAVAGGSGITPFMSMACAIRDGIEDFNLTILYGSRTEEEILFRHELDSIAAATDKVRVVYVLSDEEKPGYERGLITADLIRRYAADDYSLFICGPEGLYRHMQGQLQSLGLPERRIRREIMAVTADAADASGKEEKVFNLHVIQGPHRYDIKASSSESLLVAMERAGINAPTRCRSGECGWCRSLLVSGEVHIPEQNDRRRQMDRMTGRIHPCCAFPLSDVVLDIPAGDMEADFR